MSKSVRFCKQIPAGIYDRFAAYAVNGGMDEREAFIALVNQFTPKLHDQPKSATITAAPPLKPKSNLTNDEAIKLAWLEKQDFRSLTNDEIDELNHLSIKKRMNQ